MDYSPITGLMTVDDFERFLAQPEHAHRRYELIEGALVETMPTELHNTISAIIFVLLRAFVKAHDLGRVTYETRFHAGPEDIHNDRIPDIAFTRTERLLPLVRRGPVPQLPDLCIEIQSPDDTPRAMRQKAEYYLQGGTRRVWLVYVEKESVEVIDQGGDFQLLGKGDALTDDELLPGFTLPVADIFDLDKE